jgi:hypothetical protein
MPVPLPSVGRIVHYSESADDGSSVQCRAAVITEVSATSDQIGLAVLAPTGMRFVTAGHHAGSVVPGDPNCSNGSFHGSPHRYCACGWIEASHRGDTWHWPERV